LWSDLRRDGTYLGREQLALNQFGFPVERQLALERVRFRQTSRLQSLATRWQRIIRE
jgi:hypothetical protein